MKTVPLRSVATVLVSNVDKKSVEGELPIRLCNYTDVYYEPRLHQGLDYMAATATAEQRRDFGLRVGDTVITKDSETADDIGVAALVTGTAPDFVCGYHLAILRPGPALEPRYLQWQVASRFVQEQLGTRASGVTRYGLTYDAIRGVRLVVPPFHEQRRIADFLDDQVAHLDAAAATARQLRAAVDTRLTAAWADAYVTCSAGGPLVPLRRVIASIVDGPFGSGLTSAHYTDSGTRVIRLGNIGVAHFRPDDAAFISAAYAAELSQHAALPGDVVMAGLGDDRWPLGRATVVPAGLGPAIVKADCYRLRPRRGIGPDYLACALSAPQTQEAVKLLSRGSTRARLNTEVARDVPVVLAGGAEQANFVRTMHMAQRDHEAWTALLRLQLNLLEERKRALITACVTGEFDVSAATSRAGDAALAHLPPAHGVLAE